MMDDGGTMVLCRDCCDPFPSARFRLGYDTCMPCGDIKASSVKWTVTIPYPKGAYQVVNPADLQYNPKRTTA